MTYLTATEDVTNSWLIGWNNFKQPMWITWNECIRDSYIIQLRRKQTCNCWGPQTVEATIFQNNNENTTAVTVGQPQEKSIDLSVDHKFPMNLKTSTFRQEQASSSEFENCRLS